jgi:hypothetical protein
MHDLERLDLSSASGAYRRRRCTGSENLIRELRGRGLLRAMPETDYQKSGTLVHRAWAGENVVLDPFQKQTLAELKRLEALVLADWCGPNETCTLLGCEVRLWLRNGIEPVHSGQYDRAYLSQDGKRVLILDAKTLYGEVEPADHNDQLRELVALFRFNYAKIEHFTVAILAPKLPERITIATYDQAEAELALRLLRLGLLEGAQPCAPRTPGSWCDRCPAQLQCEELLALVPRQKETLGARIEAGEFQLPLGERGARLLEEIKTVKALIRSLEQAYKDELKANPNSLPGWQLKDGKRPRHIDDLERALEVWMTNRLAMGDFLGACELAIGKLEERLGTATGLSGKRLTQRLNELFGELISVRQNAPELVRTNKALPPRS